MNNKKANFDIELCVFESGVPKWQIADRLGTTDSNFSRKLRKELPPEDKKRIRDIIAELKGGVAQ